ncbi:MAG: late competence development ComFB family protein [Halothermotrichaceae bacterium]
MENYTEKIVLETMEDLLNKPEFKDICTCEKCLLDIATFVLNRLPAKYFASRQGELQSKIEEFESQLQVDTISTVTKAIKKVSAKPRH